MKITESSTGFKPQITSNKKDLKNQPNKIFNIINKDSYSFTGVQAYNVINFKQTARTINVVSFTGFNDPTPVAIQFKVRGVTRFQNEYGFKADQNKQQKYSNEKKGKNQKAGRQNSDKFITKPINKLADSKWQDGKVLELRIDPKTRSLGIFDSNFGQIGHIPEEISDKLNKLGAEFSAADKRTKNFRLELSNMIAGTTKGAKTTGIRVNLVYTGEDGKLKDKVNDIFNETLNDKTCKDLVFLYQPKVAPEEVLAKIFQNNAIDNNIKATNVAKTAIKNIVAVIDDPENKNILLVGHCKPDGDTLGCVLGLKNAIDFKYSDKNVDCAVDDKLPGLFRHKLPGIDNVVKRPFGKNKITRLNQVIETLKAEGSKESQEKIEILEDEKASLSRPQNLISRNKKYDVVVLMDIPTPKRFTDEFKNQIKGAKKLIYIDHHPHRLNEWQDAKDETGVDMKLIHKNGLAWVAEAVPAATMQIAIIAKNLIPNLGAQKYKDLSQDKKDNLDAFVASTVVGMSTDTSAFTRTANLLPEHMNLPVQQRPNFMPEGLSKWLMGLSDKVDKKWLREEITYDIPDTKVADLDKSSREKMVDYSNEGKQVFESLSLGVLEVGYDEMFDVWKSARKSDKLENKKDLTEFLDVQNAFKLSETMGLFKSDPSKRPQNVADYKGAFDDDRIAVLICQDKKAGELDEKYTISTQNGLRLSLRSVGGSDHGELLANLFGGGGHGGASGGRVDLPGIEIDSKLAVLINGRKETDSKIIYETLRKNIDVRTDNSLSDEEKLDMTAKINLTMDKSGKTCADLIGSVVKEIRATQEETEPEVTQRNNKRTHFREPNVLEKKISGQNRR